MPSLRLIQRLACLVVFIFATPAFSETGYLEYSAGVAFVRNQNLTGSDTTSRGFTGRIEPATAGYSIGAAVGIRMFKFMGASFRSELAVNYRHNEVSGMAITGTGIARQASHAKGHLSLFTAMINHYADFDLDIGIVPYVGFGYGYGLVISNAENRASQLKINDKTSVFAWNLMTGVTIPYTKTIDFTGGYRYVRTTDIELDSRILALGSRRLDSEYDAHEVTFGLRIKF